MEDERERERKRGVVVVGWGVRGEKQILRVRERR
jgi:hypothetical protein